MLKSPYPYFGGKSRIADLVWQRFGVVDNYVESFFGSGAVLLGCPHPGHTETVNDIDCHISNFWRAVQYDPDQVAFYADAPVNETDLHARHKWLVGRKPDLQALLDSDPDAYDAKAAGWWVWGISCWIGSGWCAASPSIADMGDLTRKIPHVGDAGRGVHRMNALTSDHRAAHTEPWQPRPFLSHDGQGIHRKRPHLVSNKGTNSARDAGATGAARQVPSLSGSQGVNRKMPHVGAGWRGTEKGEGVHRTSLDGGGIYAYFEALQSRLRRVRVCCGDWSRVLGPSVTFRHGMTAVFLDPPYPQASRAAVYAYEQPVFADVRRWAIANGDNPLLRIALCGYDFEMPAGWECVRWKAAGGYGSQSNGRGRENAGREMVCFSPHCLGINDLPLFAGLR